METIYRIASAILDGINVMFEKIPAAETIAEKLDSVISRYNINWSLFLEGGTNAETENKKDNTT